MNKTNHYKLKEIKTMEIVTEFTALIGVAALIALLINAGKVVGLVKDGTAQTWSAALNLIGMIALLFLKVFKPNLNLIAIDTTAGQIAAAGVVILGLISQLGISKLTNTFVRGIPVIGAANTKYK